MEPPPFRPKLNLKLSLSNINSPNASQSQTDSPSTQTPLRTPSLKLNFKPKATSTPTATTPAISSEDVAASGGSSKKRKRDKASVDLESKPQLARQPTLLKLVTKNAPITTKNTAPTPGIRLKTKGKIPKRPAGVGYDSELEDREIDPVLLESLVLRMVPGEDADYIRDCIANGTVGVSILQRGADIRLRFLDVNGRRGILTVRGRQYAFSVVDLPTISETMKSWDRKNFIKSTDVSQMCLVLGPCTTDDEARSYPLPPDVDPKNYQYAHGLTAPMRNVRKRRFERTARARLDDIEAIERKVNALLEADEKAYDVKYDVLDYDPRHEDVYSDAYSSGEDEDAEGEEEEDGYFPAQNGDGSGYTQTPEAQYTTEDISALEAMFEQGDDEVTATVGSSNATVALREPVSTSAEPSSAVATPDADLDEDDDDDDEGADDASDDQEAKDERDETKAKIKEAEDKIAQQREQLRRTTNQILKKKIAKKIQDLESDIRMLKRHAGLLGKGGDGDDDGDGEGEQSAGGGGGGGGGGGAGKGEEEGSEEE